jgi:hypothetical protein
MSIAYAILCIMTTKESPSAEITQTSKGNMQDIQTTREDPGQTLGIVGLVVGLVTGFSLIGLILCWLGYKKAKEVGINSTICVVGMWVNGAIMVLATLAMISFLIFFGGIALLAGTQG